MDIDKIHSCAYPIWHEFKDTGTEEIEYKIHLNEVSNNPIYTGKIYAFDTSPAVLKIDIAEICREYLETFYEDMPMSGTSEVISRSVPTNNKLSTIAPFIVDSEANAESDDNSEEVNDSDTLKTYGVMYNYNTDYKPSYTLTETLNDPISYEVDPRQKIAICGYNYGKNDIYSYAVNDNIKTIPSIESEQFNICILDLDKVTKKEDGKEVPLSPGDIITLTHDSDNKKTFTYKVVPSCKNRFVLYYVNKMGGYDALLCRGKAVESFSASHTNAKIFGDMSKRKLWGQKRIQSEITKKYKLFTNLLDDEGAAKIDNLIYSPKVWITDLDVLEKDFTNDPTTACIITDTSYTIKNFRNNKTIIYEINVEESQAYLRK